MTQIEIIEELKKLTTMERLKVVETALHLIREELGQDEDRLSMADMKRQLRTAAESALIDYTTDKELTSFTIIDSEDFHEQR
jgi:hypothetical protein